MLSVFCSMLGGEMIPYEPLNAQDYFDEWLDLGKRSFDSNPEAWQEDYPVTCLALEMAAEAE